MLLLCKGCIMFNSGKKKKSNFLYISFTKISVLLLAANGIFCVSEFDILMVKAQHSQSCVLSTFQFTK